jgi:hypothetical protein
MFVKIINRGECFSTTMEFINGVYANKTEWEKYNFYPQNGMVGEVVKITPRAYIVKIKDGIYVPMTKKGIQEISREEYLANKDKNACVGMDERQKRINNGTDDIIGNSWQHLPNMRESFKQDIIENIKRLTCDFSRNIYLPDLERSCVIYATDMILEYKKQWGSTLPPYVIDEVSEQITDVYQEFWPTEFMHESVFRCKQQIENLVKNPDARNTIDNYYSQVNQRYPWY